MPLSFASPFILIALIALPLIWWLLRLTPPRPKQETFPPTRILAELTKREETPAHSPWWLTLLRLLMAGLVIVALADPIWNAQEKTITSDGPLMVVMDNGWNAAEDWDARKATAARLISEAEERNLPVALVLTSESGQSTLVADSADLALQKLAAAEPRPLRTDFLGVASKLSELPKETFSTLAWLASGIDKNGHTEFLQAASAQEFNEIFYYKPELEALSTLTLVANTPEALTVSMQRPDGVQTLSGKLTAFDQQGRSISTTDFAFAPSETQAKAKFVLPVELRNEVTRIAIDGAQHSGSIQLLDERFRRRRVGLISGEKADAAQPLLSPLYYINRALAPFSDVREARDANVTIAVPDLIEQNISTLVLADIGTLPQQTNDTLNDWVTKGGILVRFAGPRLASAVDDTLVPVELRRGGRSLGGTLSWGTPQPLAAFDPASPFNGIPVPQDVNVSRQVLAEPGIELTERTWASLKDGTPLVTAGKRGDGWIVLFHVTADASWSTLPLSGVFVDMLRRIVAVSNGALAADRARNQISGEATEAATEETLITMPPLNLMDGFGKLGASPADARPLTISTISAPSVSLENPPGTYGTSDAFVALNLFDGPAEMALFDQSKLPANASEQSYKLGEASLLKPWLLALALIFLALDCIAVLWMAGALRKSSNAVAALLLIGAMPILGPEKAYSQDAAIDFENTLRTRIAYVKTGDARLDNLSRKGLIGLTQFIAARTSLEPAEPVGVDLGRDELAFFPLIYWPISASVAPPNAETMARVDAFMKKGGSVLFDTRDQLTGGFGSRRISPETQRLREILDTIDIPPLEPVPNNHVLTRAFYLLNVFPGRYLEGRLWVETSDTKEEDINRPARAGDGVSSIMITSNDMAAAWAVEPDGSASLPTVPANPRQRVYAYRTGANIVMYTLTGNYKSDQVHIPALLERLGQ